VASPSHAHAVLVVDDDDDTRDSLVVYLQNVGCDARGASGGENALGQLREGFQPCSIVVDVSMPGMDGWGLLTALQKDPALAALPIVMLTGSPEHAPRAVGFGVQTFFTKPADPGGIAAMIAQHCPHRAP
jgi:two-component system, chemotaxis family, chemotaxis protein CheY